MSATTPTRSTERTDSTWRPGQSHAASADATRKIPGPGTRRRTLSLLASKANVSPAAVMRTIVPKAVSSCTEPSLGEHRGAHADNRTFTPHLGESHQTGQY